MNPREIGKVLKETREKKGFNLETIWNATRIQGRIIEALEEGTADNILGRIYVLLFLKKYSAFLDLNTEDLVRNYKSFYDAPEELVLTIDKGKKKPFAININIKKWAMPVVSALSLLLALYLTFLLGVKLTSFYRTRRAMSPQKTSKKAAAAVNISNAAQKIFPIPKDKTIDLTLKSTGEVWVRVWKDDKVAFEGTLARDKEKKWSAGDNIRLWAGRAEALDFTVNGTRVGRVARGNVKRIELSRSGLKVRKKWLLGAKK
jgi:hypothetical protein